MSDSDTLDSSAAAGEPLPLEPRFPGEPDSSIRARGEAMETVLFLKHHAGGSASLLHHAMKRAGRAAPSTSTTGQWARGVVSSRERATKTAYAFDAFGRGVPGYPPTGRTLQAIVRDVAPVPRGAGQARLATHDEVDGDTVVVDARVRLQPGEQFDRADVTSRRELTGHGRQQVVVTIVVTTLALVLLIGILVVRHRGGTGDDRPAGPGPSVATTASGSVIPTVVTAPPGVGVERSLRLDDANFCSWRLGSNPIPLVSLSPVTMRIDARCNTPAQRDPGKDAGAAVYGAPSNDDASLAIGRLGDNSAFVPVCWVRADRVVDDAAPQNASRIWLKAQNPDGYVPNVNVGGGYTAGQLRALGLESCAG